MSSAHAPSPFVALATRADGGKKLTIVHARDRRHANELLRRQRLLPVQTWALPRWTGGSMGVPPLASQAEIHLQLSQLISRGVPLVEALDTLIPSMSESLRPRMARVREMVASGSAFADAAASQKLFDPVTIATYRSAERTGDLAGAAKQLSTSSRRMLAVRGKAATLLFYPVIVMSMSALLIVFLLVYLVPRVGSSLAEQFASQGKSLPWYTQALMSVGIFLRDYWALSLLGVLVFFTLSVIFRKRIAALAYGLSRRVPVLREVVLAGESARFFTVMAAMTRNGIPLADALGVASGAIGHPILKQQLLTLRQKLIDGGVLRSLIESVTALPLSTRRLLIAAERSGDLESAFETLSADCADDLDRRATRLLAVLEPALIILMAVVVGGALLTIMIPMFNLINQAA
jgi:general secretion pathway protein F